MAVSLTSLKWSRSARTTAIGRPSRRAAASSRSSTSRMAAWFHAPVRSRVACRRIASRAAISWCGSPPPMFRRAFSSAVERLDEVVVGPGVEAGEQVRRASREDSSRT